MRRGLLRSLRVWGTAALLALGAAAGACTLNPQPLPPSDFSGGGNSQEGDPTGGFGATPKNPPPSPADAGVAADVDGGGTRQDGGGDAEPVPNEAGIDAPVDGSNDVATGG